LQRKITGEPPSSHPAAAFWIRPGDEDVWVSPYAKIGARFTCNDSTDRLNRNRRDYVDIPYWMTHFDGGKYVGEFDDATVAAFRENRLRRKRS